MKHKNLIILLVIAIIVVLFAPFLLNTHSAAVFNPQYSGQDINLEVLETSSYNLSIDTDITSFSITGIIEGSGKAKVYLQDSDGDRLLVYSGSQMQTPAGITGFIAASQADANYFRNACEETCYFTTENHPYSLYIELEPSTSIIIQRVVYK
jgi:competence protein ComGC